MAVNTEPRGVGSDRNRAMFYLVEIVGSVERFGPADCGWEAQVTDVTAALSQSRGIIAANCR